MANKCVVSRLPPDVDGAGTGGGVEADGSIVDATGAAAAKTPRSSVTPYPLTDANDISLKMRWSCIHLVDWSGPTDTTPLFRLF